jgi:hypothetical protein
MSKERGRKNLPSTVGGLPLEEAVKKAGISLMMFSKRWWEEDTVKYDLG